MYEAQEMIKKGSQKNNGENVGLSDELEIKIIKSDSIKNQEVKQ
jgi:hypothetical protein